MKILNLTHSEFWLPGHFEYLLGQVGHTGETMFLPIANMNAATANALWQEHKDYFETFDAIFVSHLSTWSRVFLQNNWTKPLFVWFFFRFDFDIDDRATYYDLLRDANNSRHNVKFFAATETDRIYAEEKLGFAVPVIKPFVYINNDSKTAIPCDDETFYLVGKWNESLFVDKLRELGVSIYRQDWTTSVPDLRGVKAVIHFPYVFATRSFIENLAIGNVYFLPTERFLNELRRFPGYFWDSTLGQDHSGDYHLTEWHSQEHNRLFVYFDSLEELRNLSRSPNLKDIIAEKKTAIQEFVQRQNDKALREWTELLK